jgi:hypothetical protein
VPDLRGRTDNAKLRHYLARLARASRSFSRCLQPLWRAVKIFVFAWNRRQLFKQAYPQYAPALFESVSVQVKSLSCTSARRIGTRCGRQALRRERSLYA